MAEKERRTKNEAEDEIEETIDSYTGELEPVAEDADQFIEVVPQETNDRNGQNYLLNEETSMDSYAADADSNAAAEQAAHYTEDEDIEADFAERQKLAASGRDVLQEKLEEHHSLSPRISGGDLDAAWQDANVAGDEAVGGSVSTPDQDVVEELGEAAGLTYKDDEPLAYDEKVLDRDRDRWELNPASAQDQEEELENEDEDNDEDEDDEEEDLDELEELDELDEDEEDEEDLDELGYEIEDDEEEDFDELEDENEEK